MFRAGIGYDSTHSRMESHLVVGTVTLQLGSADDLEQGALVQNVHSIHPLFNW